MKRFSILFAALSIILSLSAAYQPQFSTAGFYQLAGTGRTAYSMNVAWRFVKTDVKNAESVNFDDSKWEVVSVPHGLEYLPKDASGSINYQGPAWYRKHFTPDMALTGKKLFLHFEAVMGKCKVWVNGKLLTEHVGGYLPVIADISNDLKWGEDNVIAVRTDNNDDPSYAPGKAQNVLDFCYFGGIYRDCWLIATNNVHITDPNYENEVAGGGLFVSYDKVSDKSALVNLKTHIRNELSTDFAAELIYELKQTDGKIVNRIAQKLNIISGKAAYSTKGFELKQPKLWSPESPYLYWLNVYVKDNKGNIVDGYSTRIGIRSIEFKQKSGLWINGKPYEKIMGTNRHQDFAVVGNALPNSIQWRDAKKLRDAGMKVIRTHYVIDPAFMDAFRQPKTSYYMFMSQRSPVKSDLLSETGPMLYIANEMTPFSPNDVTVYSNCDEVRLTFLKNGKQESYKKDPNRKGMPSPIITFKNMFDFMACKGRARAGKQDEVYLLAEGLIHGKVVASYKVSPAERADHIRLRLDNDGVELLANGSDIVTVIAEMVDKKGTVKRLNSNTIRFNIEGEGRLLGDESTQTNTSELIWGTAPVLVQSTTKAGKIRITASLVHEGSQTPVGGELIFNSLEDTTPTIFNQKEVDLIGKQALQSVQKLLNKSELQLENERLRKELNDLKVNEVGKQQNKFGAGIN